MAAADDGLVSWIKGHNHLVPTAVENGESGMALLLLWEVDHQRPYPSVGGDRISGALTGFTRRLQDRVMKDPELSSWLEWRDVHAPLCGGLAPSHHRRWAVRVLAPAAGEPGGWYAEFVDRWRAYLEVLVRPVGSRPTTMITAEQAARIRPEEGMGEPPGSMRQLAPSARGVDSPHRGGEGPTVAPPTEVTSPNDGSRTVAAGPPDVDLAERAVVSQRRSREAQQAEDDRERKRRRPSSPQRRSMKRGRTSEGAEAEAAPPRCRQKTMQAWLRPRELPGSGVEESPEGPLGPQQGRAVEGPPT